MNLKIKEVVRKFFDPEVSTVVLCETCKELVLFERYACTICGVPLDHEALRREAEQRKKIVKAVSVARSIQSINASLFIFLTYAISNIMYLYDPGTQGVSITWGVVLTVFGMIPPVFIFIWLDKYGELSAFTKEYILARRRLKWALYFWAVAHIINFCVIVTANFRINTP